MSAYNLPGNSDCVPKGIERPEALDSRNCPYCGKCYDYDKRALPAYLEHVADCQDDEQASLDRWTGGATDEDVRQAVEAMEADR